MSFGCLFLLLLADPAPKAIPDGKAKVEMEVGGHSLDVFTYKPKNYGTDSPLVVVCHGMLRNADEYRDNARGLADRLGALVVAPLFDSKRFPHDAYQLGGIKIKGDAQPAAKWTIGLVPQLADAVRRREGRKDMPCHLVGHSAGGQFLERLAGFVTSDAVRVVAANPGSHLFPTRDAPFPYGFGGLPKELSDDAALKRYLAQPLTIYLGTADVGNENLPSGPEAKKQGATRYERGKNCFKAAQELAKAKGWPFQWRLVEAPGVDHDNKKMFDHERAKAALLGPD
jgi:poly(3-hydroxybutyrate) depolymerase